MVVDPCNIVQGSKNPVFKSEVSCAVNFECTAGYGQILIEGYFPECFIEISIKCFTCHEISKTPPLEEGEILSTVIATVTKGKSYLIASTVEYSPSVIMSAPDAVERVRRLCKPSGKEEVRQIDAELISFTKERYVRLTSIDYELQKKIVSKGGQGVKFEYALVWALETLADVLHSKESIASDRASMAIEIIALFNSVCDRWSNSHRFPQVAKQFGKKENFFHTVFTLIAADMISSDGGVMVGLSLEDQIGVPNPDLYVRRGANEKSHLEVKAPADFQITAGHIGEARVKTKLQRVLKDSSRQINRNSRGVLVVGASINDANIVRELEKWMKNLVKSRESFHSGLAALAIIVRRNDAQGSFYEIISATNEHYAGMNPWRDS